MEDWIDREAALARLRVKPQTLYAYASRGRIRVQPDPDDTRRSLYNAEDIVMLTRRQKRGRKPTTIAASAMAWGEPAIATSLSAVHRGKLYYRGQDALEMARHASLEEIAALLWQSDQPLAFSGSSVVGETPYSAMAKLIPCSQPMLGRNGNVLLRDAETIVGTIASTCATAAGDQPLHRRLATAWGIDEFAAAKIRQVLAAMADHDLNASTFATRVAASTGASMSASVLAGLCTLSGPLHGGAANAFAELVSDARLLGVVKAVDRLLDLGVHPQGFGHPLYPGGDPRAHLFLEGIEIDPLLADLSETIVEKTGLLPNCDFALVAMVDALGLPLDAPFTLFLIGRSVGWCAHAMEQNRQGNLIRPRGRYEGEPIK